MEKDCIYEDFCLTDFKLDVVKGTLKFSIYDYEYKENHNILIDGISLFLWENYSDSQVNWEELLRDKSMMLYNFMVRTWEVDKSQLKRGKNKWKDPWVHGLDLEYQYNIVIEAGELVACSLKAEVLIIDGEKYSLVDSNQNWENLGKINYFN